METISERSPEVLSENGKHLSAAWREETAARADRARSAVERGLATEQQAERDARLCAIIQQLADVDCDLAACPTVGLANNAGINDLFDAIDMVDAIQARARTKAPDSPHTLNLRAIADTLRPQVEETRVIVFAEYRRMRRGTPLDFTAVTPPWGWRIPLNTKGSDHA